MIIAMAVVLVLASAAAGVVIWQSRDGRDENTDTARCGIAAASATANLTDISSGRHDTFDRIVLEFAGPEPECSARYVSQIEADASGRPIPLEGSAFLRVTVQAAAAHDDGGNPTYKGPHTFATPELKNITAVALAGDFEGVVTVGLGMTDKTHYKVFTLPEPTRVVIDVAH